MIRKLHVAGVVPTNHTCIQIHPGHKLQPGCQTAPFFVDLALHLLISNAINSIHGSELADPPQQRLSVYQALVGVSLLWVNKPSGSHQTCKRRFHEWTIT